MNFFYTDGKNRDFIALCQMLDEFLNDAVGGEKQRSQYIRYNGLDDIHDVILAYDGKTPIACAGYKFYDSGTAEVKRVFVREEFRGRGISKLLMQTLEERAKSQGYSAFILETGAVLSAATSLYKKIGYSVIENYGQYKNMKESVCMKKNLQN